LFESVHQLAYLNQKWLVRHIFNHNCTETYFIFLWMSNIYIRLTFTNSVSVYIWNHAVELLSIRINSEVIKENSRGRSGCWWQRHISSRSIKSKKRRNCVNQLPYFMSQVSLNDTFHILMLYRLCKRAFPANWSHKSREITLFFNQITKGMMIIFELKMQSFYKLLKPPFTIEPVVAKWLQDLDVSF
jgi:hypothetical protein